MNNKPTAVIFVTRDNVPFRVVITTPGMGQAVIPVQNSSIELCKRVCRDVFNVDKPIVATPLDGDSTEGGIS